MCILLFDTDWTILERDLKFMDLFFFLQTALVVTEGATALHVDTVGFAEKAE